MVDATRIGLSTKPPKQHHLLTNLLLGLTLDSSLFLLSYVLSETHSSVADGQCIVE